MALISTYTTDGSIDGTEFLLGREASGTTKQFSLSALRTFLSTVTSVTTSFTGTIVPDANNSLDIGSSSLQWRNLYIDSIAYIDQLGTHADRGIAYISGGGIDNVAIGNETPNAGTFTNVNVTGTLSFDGVAGNTGQFLVGNSGATPTFQTVGLNGLSDVLIADSSLYIGQDPSATDSAAQFNIGVGATALDAITTGDRNVAIGYDAGTAIQSTSDTVLIGFEAGESLSTGQGTGSVFLGSGAGKSVTSGDYCIAVGAGALNSNTVGDHNIAIGHNALAALDTSGGDDPDANIAIGHEAGTQMTTGDGSVFLGHKAGKSTVTGDNNHFIGNESGTSNTTGHSNTALGHRTLYTSAVGDGSVAIGHEALYASSTNDGGTLNTAVGYRAGKDSTTATANTLIGSDSGSSITTGGFNTAVGGRSLTSNTVGTLNTAIGYQALFFNGDGSKSVAIGHATLAGQDPSGATDMHNVAVGFESGNDVTTGTLNTLVGSLAGDAITTGSGNTALGYNVAFSAVGAANQTVIGNGAAGHGDNVVVIGNAAVTAIHPGDNNGVDLGSGSYSFKDAYIQGSLKIGNTGGSAYFQFPTATGTAGQVLKVPSSGNILEWTTGTGITFALQDNSLLVGHTVAPTGSASNNTSLGIEALDALTEGDDNVAVGYLTGSAVTTGSSSVLVGRGAGEKITTGGYHVAIGRSALNDNVDDFYNVAVGYESLKNDIIGSNTAVGSYSGNKNTTGSAQVFMGYEAGKNTTTGPANTAIGYGALTSNVVGGQNTAIGTQSLNAHVAGSVGNSRNTALGYRSGYGTTSGFFNVFMGAYAGDSNTTGDNNVIIGYNAEKSAVGTDNEIVIGKDAVGLGANTTVIGNTSTTAAYLLAQRQPTDLVTATDALTATESGKLFVFNDADGAVLTLPDSGPGDLIGVYYDFAIAVTATSNAHKVVCADTTNEKLFGQVHTIDTDTSDTNASFAAQAGDNFSAINCNGTTTGIIGSAFRVQNIAADKWGVAGNIHHTGAAATPFATS